MVLLTAKFNKRILGTSLVTTCIFERSFSAVKRLKTYTRSTRVSERLNDIAFIPVYQEIVPNIEKVIDLFSTKNRRLSFTQTQCTLVVLQGGRGEVEPPTKFSKSGGLTGPQLLEVNCWERGGDFFRGEGCNFHIKNKLKSEISNEKEGL